MNRIYATATTLLFTLLFSSSTFPVENQPQQQTVFSKQSSDQQTVLVELFTSEGCSSCPPADKWLSELEQRGYSNDQVIPLSLHVDYWDYIGWKDPYAQAQFADRQARYIQLNRAKVAYTPQIMVNGDDLRSKSGFAEYVRETKQKSAKVKYTMTATVSDNIVDVTVKFDKNITPDNAANLIIAITENDLSNQVSRGENTGRTLKHSYVTRIFKNLGSIQSQITEQLVFEPHWNRENLSLVAFLQKDDGEVLQALSLPLTK